MWISHLESTPVKLPPEIAQWARQLLAQTRAILEKAQSGDAVLAPEEIERLRKTERDLSAALDAEADAREG